MAPKKSVLELLPTARRRVSIEHWLLLGALGLTGVQDRGTADVSKAINDLGAALSRKEETLASEFKEMRKEQVETTKMLVVAVEQIREHGRRLENLETRQQRHGKR